MDDFFDDVHTSGPKSHKGSESLPPIVEVPSDGFSITTESNQDAQETRGSSTPASTSRTERSDYSEDTEATETQRSLEPEDSDVISNDDDDEVLVTDRQNSSRRRRVKNGRQHVDMTPPDKLLSRAERKAKRYFTDKKANKAVKEYIRITALSRIVYGDGHWKLARSFANLAQAYFELKNYAPQAQYHCETAKNIMSTGVHTSSSSTDKANIMEVHLKIYYTLGKALTALKKLSEAEIALNKADDIAKERGKISSVSDDDLDDWDIKIFLAIARLSAKQQKHAMATTYFEKALDLMEVKYGEDSPELIPVYQGLGYVEQSKGTHANHEQAIENFLQAHSIASGYYKNSRVEVAETARALANAYSNVGSDDAETSAESYLNECLASYQIAYGPNHAKTLDLQDELARLMVRTDRAEEATTLLRSTVEAKKEVYGDLSSEVANTWKLIGSIYLSQGDSEKALRALKKCHNVECALYGTNNKNSKETQRTMDLLLANPSLKAKQKKTKEEELKERPRFNSIVNRNTSLGGFKQVGLC